MKTNKTFFSRLLLLAFLLFLPASVMMSEDNAGKLDRLKADKRKNELEMHKLRVKLIKESPELTKLHEKMMALLKEIADKTDNSNEMKILLAKNKQLEAEISKLSLDKKAGNE